MISGIYIPRFFAMVAFSLTKDGKMEDDRRPFVGSFVSFCKGGFYGIISYTSILLPSLLVIMRSRTFRYCIMSVDLAVLPTSPRLL